MTLIVGAIDGESVTMTGDTKVTFDEDAIKSARLFEEALPKIVLLRDNLAVGVAGAGPRRMIEDLMMVRDADLLDVLDHLCAERDGDFLVGALNPSRLYEVRVGKITAVPEGQHAWAGDGRAFDDFEKLAASWPPDDDELTRLKTSMDSIVSLGRSNSVGGFALTARTHEGRFRFLPTTFTIFGEVDMFDTYEGQVLPGAESTPGALGIYVNRGHVGQLYTHEHPFVGRKIQARDRGIFAARALSEHGQTLFT
jgi:hypothetical protein